MNFKIERSQWVFVANVHGTHLVIYFESVSGLRKNTKMVPGFCWLASLLIILSSTNNFEKNAINNKFIGPEVFDKLTF